MPREDVLFAAQDVILKGPGMRDGICADENESSHLPCQCKAGPDVLLMEQSCFFAVSQEHLATLIFKCFL